MLRKQFCKVTAIRFLMSGTALDRLDRPGSRITSDSLANWLATDVVIPDYPCIEYIK